MKNTVPVKIFAVTFLSLCSCHASAVSCLLDYTLSASLAPATPEKAYGFLWKTNAGEKTTVTWRWKQDNYEFPDSRTESIMNYIFPTLAWSISGGLTVETKTGLRTLGNLILLSGNPNNNNFTAHDLNTFTFAGYDNTTPGISLPDYAFLGAPDGTGRNYIYLTNWYWLGLTSASGTSRVDNDDAVCAQYNMPAFSIGAKVKIWPVISVSGGADQALSGIQAMTLSIDGNVNVRYAISMSVQPLLINPGNVSIGEQRKEKITVTVNGAPAGGIIDMDYQFEGTPVDTELKLLNINGQELHNEVITAGSATERYISVRSTGYAGNMNARLKINASLR